MGSISILCRLHAFQRLEDRRLLAVDFSEFADALQTPLADLAAAVARSLADAEIPLASGLDQAPPFHNSVRDQIDAAIRAVDTLSGAEAENALKTEIVTRLGPPGLNVLGDRAGSAAVDADDVEVDVDDAAATVDVTFDLATQPLQPITVGADFSVGLKSLPFYHLGGDLSVSLGVEVAYQNFDIHFDGSGATDLVTFGNLADDVVQFSLDASLVSDVVDLQVGFLQFTASDAGSSMGVSFAVDMADDGGVPAATVDGATLSGSADLRLHLATSISSNFPNVSADFVVGWDFTSGADPEVRFENVSVGLGSLVSGFLTPVVERVEPLLNLVEPVINVLTTDVPGLDQLGVNLSLLDIANIASGLDGVPPDLQAYLDVATTLVTTADIVTNIEAQGDQTVINFGTFDLTDLNGNLRQGVAQPALANPGLFDLNLTSFQTGGGIDLAAIQAALDASPLPESLKNQLADVLLAAQNGVALSFPIIENPGATIFRLLVGQDAELMTIDAQFIPPVEDDAFDNETFGVPGLPGITGGLIGEVIPKIVAQVGYDTFGLRQFLESGDAADILDGFYFGEQTEFSLSGRVEAFVAFSAAGVFNAGLEGGLNLSLLAEIISSGENPSAPDIDGGQHARVRFKEFDGCAFHTAGEITFGIDAFVEVGLHIGQLFFGHREEFDIFEVEILSFEAGCLGDPAADEEPLLAEIDPATGVVTLLVGPRATDRNIAPDEINEVYEVRVIAPPGAPPTQGQGIEVKAFGRTQIIEGATGIVADTLDGADSIQVLESSDGKRFAGHVSLGSAASGDKYFLSTALGFTSLAGGSGQDVLVGGFGDNLLVGNGGADQLIGGDNPGFENTLLGGDQDDVIRGGTGRNVVQAGPGNDQITAGPGDDLIQGELGNDVIQAGAGNSTIEGGFDDDVIYWTIGDGAITASGGGGVDLIGLAGDSAADDAFILAPDNGAVRVLGPGAPGPVISLVDDVEYFSVDGLGGADQTLVNLLEGTDVLRVAVNPSDNLARDFLEDLILLWASTAPDQLVVEQLEVDIEVIGETCEVISGTEVCTPVYDQGGAMRVSGFPKLVTATLGQAPYDVVLMNYDDDLRVFAGLADDEVDVLGITGPTLVDGGADNDQFEVLPTSSLDFLADLTIDGGAGANFLHADHRGVGTAENVVVSDAVIQSDVLPGVHYGSSQLGNFQPGVQVTATAQDDSIEVVSTKGGDTTIVAGHDRNDAIVVGSMPDVPEKSQLTAIAGRLLIDGGSGTDDSLAVLDGGAAAGNADVRLDLVSIPEAPGEQGVEITGLAGPLDDVSIVYKEDAFEQVRIESSSDGNVAEKFTFVNTDSAPLIVAEQAGDAEFRVERTGAALELRGDDGQEIAYITQPTGNLDNLGGTLTFLGGGGPDRLEVFDKSAGPGTTYQFSQQSLLRISGGGTTIDFDGALEELALETTDFDDSVAILQMPLAGATEIDQGGGTNALIGPSAANVWNITAPNQGDLNGTIAFQNSAVLTGSTEQDRFTMTGAGAISIIDGGGGVDELDYSPLTSPVAVNLATGQATNVSTSVSNIENVTGGAADDLIRGNDQQNTLSGGPGNDLLLGFGANDFLFGGSGRDLLFGGLGADALSGGSDDDILIHGQTAHDNNDAALMALLAEWTNTGPQSSYADRVSNLNHGGGLNGGVTLSSGTVFLEGSLDSLTGQGGLDWFWIRLGQDVINDLEASEQTNGA